MAGIKHDKWMYFNPVDFQPAAKDFEEQMKREVEQGVYCRRCGQPIVAATMDKNQREVNWQMEQQNGMHEKCWKEMYQQLQSDSFARRMDNDWK